MTREEIAELYPDSEILFADGFDECIIGIDHYTHRLIYDTEKCINALVTDQNMSYWEAYEYFYFNTVGAYVGKLTPIWSEPLN